MQMCRTGAFGFEDGEFYCLSDACAIEVLPCPVGTEALMVPVRSGLHKPSSITSTNVEHIKLPTLLIAVMAVVISQ